MNFIYFYETRFANDSKNAEVALAGRHGNSFYLEGDEDGETSSMKEGSLRSDQHKPLEQLCISKNKHQVNTKDG